MRAALSSQQNRRAPVRLDDIPLFSMLKGRMKYLAARQRVIAENVANADTPGFQARDLTFDHELSLAQKVRALPMSTLPTPALDLRLVDSPDARMRPDGNNVDIDRQMTRIAQNALYHNVVVQLLSSRFAALKTAINGHA